MAPRSLSNRSRRIASTSRRSRAARRVAGRNCWPDGGKDEPGENVLLGGPAAVCRRHPGGPPGPRVLSLVVADPYDAAMQLVYDRQGSGRCKPCSEEQTSGPIETQSRNAKGRARG